MPVQFLAFDLLWLDGQPLLDLPLVERRARLAEVLVETRDIRLSQVVEGAGTAFFEQVKELKLEGIVAKRAASPYRPGACSPDWRKIKALCLQDCVIVGWTRASRPGRHPGLAAGGLRRRPAALCRQRRHRLHPRLPGRPPAQLAPWRCPSRCSRASRAPPAAGARFVRPELICEVEYLKWTQDDKLRAASFKGLRPDKPVTDARREHPVAIPS